MAASAPFPKSACAHLAFGNVNKLRNKAIGVLEDTMNGPLMANHHSYGFAGVLFKPDNANDIKQFTERVIGREATFELSFGRK